MKFNRLQKLGAYLIMLSMSACYGGAQYPMSFVSADAAEFEKFAEECSKRPSPPARTQRLLGDTKVYITYCQPAVKGRKIWGDLVDYKKMWRTGANEATVFSTSGDVLVNGDTVKAGNYALYTIPTQNDWEVILNRQYDTWGAYNYDQKQDVLRFTVQTKTLSEFVERMTFDIDQKGIVNFGWEKLGFEFYVMPLKSIDQVEAISD